MEISVFASGSKGNCYRISDGSTALLLECGISYKRIQEALDFRVKDLAGCLVSHEHGDHAKAVPDLIKAGVDIYCSRGTAGALGLVSHRVRAVEARRTFTVGSWSVLPFETIHDAAEPLGFVLSSGDEKLLFATDTAYLKYRFPGCTHLMLEANYDLDVLKTNVIAGVVNHEVKRRVLRSHMNLDTLCGFLRANDLSQVRQIILLHLSDDSANAASFKHTVQALTGKEVTIADARPA